MASTTLAVKPQIARAHALHEEGRVEEAEQILRELVARHPDELETHLELAAQVLTQRTDTGAATRHALRAAELAWMTPTPSSGRPGLPGTAARRTASDSSDASTRCWAASGGQARPPIPSTATLRPDRAPARRTRCRQRHRSV